MLSEPVGQAIATHIVFPVLGPSVAVIPLSMSITSALFCIVRNYSWRNVVMQSMFYGIFWGFILI